MAKPWPALVVVGVLVVGLLAWAVADRVEAHRAPATHAGSAAAALAAVQLAAPALVSYDHRTLDDLAERVRPLLTRSCGEQYRHAVDAFAPQVRAARASATATVRAAGVRRAGADRVEVLAFVAIRSADQSRPQPLETLVPLGLALERHGGRWLVAAEVTDPGADGKEIVGCDVAAR